MRSFLVLALASAALLAATPNYPTKASLLKCNHDVKILNAAWPQFTKDNFKPNAEANALVTVSDTGKPLSAKIVQSSGSPSVDKATVDAAMASTYSPELSACKYKVGHYLFHVETGSH